MKPEDDYTVFPLQVKDCRLQICLTNQSITFEVVMQHVNKCLIFQLGYAIWPCFLKPHRLNPSLSINEEAIFQLFLDTV